jgi:hypothetical protein
MTDRPVDPDKHRGMAAQKATDLRRALADVEAHVRELREREAELEHRMMTVPAASWPEAAVKARHLLNLYAASLPTEDTRHRALVAALLDDFARLSGEGEAIPAARNDELRESLCQESITQRRKSWLSRAATISAMNMIGWLCCSRCTTAATKFPARSRPPRWTISSAARRSVPSSAKPSLTAYATA